MYVIDSNSFQKALKARGYHSIGQLAKFLGIHRNTIHYYLSGHGVFPEKFEKIIQTLNLNPSEILVKKEEPPQNELELIAPIVDKLHEKFPDVTFILFGSRTRKRHHQYSDWDIGVFSRQGLPYKRFFDVSLLGDELTEDFPYFVDFVNLNFADEDFLIEISKTWIFLCGQQGDWIELNKRSRYGKKDQSTNRKET